MNLIHLRLPEIKSRLRWQLASAWAALGAPELFFLALLAFWLGLSVRVNQPLHAEVIFLDEKIQALRASHHEETRLGQAGKQHVDITQNFLAFLPDDRQRERQLAKLHQLADKRGLQLARVDYRIETVAGLPLQRLSLRLSVQGGYAMQRQFMRALLEALPNFALERITLEKTTELPGGMDMLLDASLYYRTAEQQPVKQAVQQSVR